MAEAAKRTLVIVAKTDGSFSAKDEAGVEWGSGLVPAEPLVTVGGDGFADYFESG